MVIFGTRPEVIKMAPVIWELKKQPDFETIVVNTAQHRTMIDQMLPALEITPDEDLNIMTQGQDLSTLTTGVLSGVTKVLNTIHPDLLLVQGDTTTVFAGALAAFDTGVPVAHVEAGLRSGNIRNPFPEEANRKLVSTLADVHFAPSQNSRNNLIQEHIAGEKIYVTGNTVIDTLLAMTKKELNIKNPQLLPLLQSAKQLVLVTSHRRESWGDAMLNAFRGIRKLASSFPQINFLFPVHLNPVVREAAQKAFQDTENVFLTEPLEYLEFTHVMKRAKLIITDSGGIQEEGPALGIPVMVMRETTERPEAVQSGQAILVGTDSDIIYHIGSSLLSDPQRYAEMSRKGSPFGDGKAGKRIAAAVTRWLKGEKNLLSQSEQFVS